MISVDGLVRVAGGRRVLDDVSFRVGRGEILGFLGPNGAGKTTTLRVLAGWLRPTAGRVRVADADPADGTLASRRRVGYAPEHVPAGPERIGAFLGFVARAKGARGRGVACAVAEALTEVGLAGFERRGIGRVSKGERQRVGLAAALLGDPDVLLLDEPTSGLDPTQLAAVRALVRRQRGRRTVLFSTHILSEIGGTCDRVVVLHRGRVVATGGADGRLDGETAEESVRLEVDGPADAVVAAVRGVPGVGAVEPLAEEEGDAGGGRDPVGVVRLRIAIAPGVDARAAPAELAAAVVARGWGLHELRRETAGLEETFLRLVAGEGPR